MKPALVDSAHPDRYPERYFPTRCAVCQACWFDQEAGRCLYAGPYQGYKQADDSA